MARNIDPMLAEFMDRYGVDIGDENDCWMWPNSVDSYGYGHARIDGRLRLVHRVVCGIHSKQNVDGFVVMHTCDTPACVNPGHLKIGTQLDNIADRVSKGRNGACRGDDSPCAKISSDDVRRIRSAFSSGIPHREITRAYQISKSQLYRIVKRESWRHV